MADWTLIPAAVSLRAAFNQLCPDRDHTTDGAVGNAAHAATVSDHNPDETGAVPIHDADNVNEVHAIDVDTDLRTPGLTMAMVVRFVVGRCRAGAERRLRYVIFERVIYSASAGWQPRPYPGVDPHTGHAHFSFSYDSSLEASTASWHLEEIPVALTDADKTWLTNQIDTAVRTALGSVMAIKIGDRGRPGRTFGQLCTDLAGLRGYLVGDALDTATAAIKPEAPVRTFETAADLIINADPAARP
jgi:hypothetical protein